MFPMIATTQLQIRSRSIIQYTHFERSDNYYRSFGQKKSYENLREHATYTGMLCPGAKKRLTKAIEILVQSAEVKTHHFISKRTGQPRSIKYDLNFITLTVYSTDRNITGKEAHKRCLEPFLLWMSRHCGCTMYIWKAELQQREQIHYHITSDTFIDQEQLRLKWNELQREAGYLDSFYAKYGHWEPNSTDVHSVYKEFDVIGYLKKKIIKEYNIQAEIAKDVQNKKTIGGKVWDCSLNLKAASFFKTDGTTGTEKYLNRAVKNEDVIKVKTDHCNVYTFKRKRASSILSQYDRLLYKEHIAGVKRYQRKPPRKKETLSLEEIEIFNSLNLIPKVIPAVKMNEKKKLVKINYKPDPDLFNALSWYAT